MRSSIRFYLPGCERHCEGGTTAAIFLLSLIFSMFLFSPFEIYSQTFPVQASVQLTPPYSLNLADYSSPESERLAFTILLADNNRPELQVRFRLRIEGQGIEIQTSPGYNPPPYVLQGGIPERITGFDLAPYFDPANLEFRGVTRAQYLQTSKLPEGLYRLCIEVVEYNRNVVVSNTGCANAWLVLNDPPLVNVPANADKIRILNPQNIIFQWTPRHTGSPNAAFRTEYECTLVELWPATRNPNDAILSSPPILKETTSSTTFIYGPSETQLVAGRHYAFRVQAKSISGISQLDLFKNNGYSQVITFQYGDPCLAPEPVTATALDPERIKLEWTASAQHTEYAVEYRQAGSTQWYDQETYLPYTTLTNLRAGTSYEYQVKAVCGPVESEPGELKSATTKDLIPSSLVCGTSLPVFSLDNTQLLDQLNPGDMVTAGDFDVTIRKATGTGSFTGSGTVEVAFFKNAKVNVEFESIKVNPEYRLVEGKMEVKGIGVDVLGDNVTDLLDQLDDALITADDILKDVAADLDLADEILDEVGKLANDVADNGPFTTDQEAKLDGVTADKYLEEAEKAMKSAASALASAGSVGNTAEAARSVAQALTLRNRANKLKKIYAEADTLKVIAVEFVGTDNYGFDIQGYPQHRLHYNIMVTPDNVSTSVPWVSTKEGEASNVVARLLPSANIPAENIIFKAGESTLVANQNGNDWTVALPVAETGATLTVRAIDKTTGDTVGKLDVVTYSPIARKLNIVPVGTTTTLTAADVEAELDRIYKQAVADWDVAMLPALSVPGYTGTLQDDKQALLSVYSDGMKEIIRTFEASGTYSKDEFYLFLVDNSQTGKAGYMPRKHRYGFIYQNENASPLQTIAHELGHGAFRLQHTFEEYPTIAKATSNLMDYDNGTMLRKYQWDLIHNPPVVIGLLEDEGEGALKYDCPKWFSVSTECESVGKILDYVKTAVKEKKKLVVNWPAGKEEYVAENIELDGVKYDKIKILNSIQKEGEVIIEPWKYENISQDIIMADGKINQQRGFVFKTENKGLLPLTYYEVVTILLYQRETVEERLESLRRYLFINNTLNTFEKYQEKIFDHEGGFVDDPVDAGGATNKGITLTTFAAYAEEDLGIKPTLENLKSLSNEQASIIYKKRYWDKIKANEIENGSIAYMLYDFNVNAGNNAIKSLQSVLVDLSKDVDIDGIMGKKTIDAINNTNAKELFDKFKQKRLDFYQSLVDNSVSRYREVNPDATESDLLNYTQKKFEQGWKNRTNSILFE